MDSSARRSRVARVPVEWDGMTTERKPLVDFANEMPTRVGPLPWLETIPEWDEVLTGWRSGLTQSQIREWLIVECGYTPEQVTPSRMAHLSKKHKRFSRGRS